MAVGPRADRRIRDGRASRNAPPVDRDARNRASRATAAPLPHPRWRRITAPAGRGPETTDTRSHGARISRRRRLLRAPSNALERRLTFPISPDARANRPRHRPSPTRDRSPRQIEEERRELDKALRSSNAREKLDGLKRLIGMMSTGRDVSTFFAAVVMNLAQDSFEVKVLVYIYLVRTAEQKADEALLSINSFQKDLAHPNPRVRALALRLTTTTPLDPVGRWNRGLILISALVFLCVLFAGEAELRCVHACVVLHVPVNSFFSLFVFFLSFVFLCVFVSLGFEVPSLTDVLISGADIY